MNRLLPYLLAISLVSIISACSDGGTGTDAGDPPAVPDMQHVEMDLSIFDLSGSFDQVEKTGELNMFKSLLTDSDHRAQNNENSGYEEASWHAWIVNQFFVSFSTFPSIYFNTDMWGEPENNGNAWIWDFSHSVEGESASMVVTAEEAGNMWAWELRVTVSGTDNDIDNALLLSAEISSDGNEGSWRFHDIDIDGTTGGEYMDMDFRNEGDITTYIGFDVPEDNIGFEYERDGTHSSLFYWEGDGEGAYTTIIEWNNESGAGWIENTDYNDNQRACWDTNFETVDC